MPPPGRRRHILNVTAIFLVALALRAPGMIRSIWYDEWCRTHQYLNSDNLRQILLHDVHNPLYNAFMYGWIQVFGDSEISIRLPSLLAGLGSLWLLCRFVAARLGTPLALAVGALFACNPVHVWYSTQAKNTMFVVACSTLAVLALARLTERPRPTIGPVAGAAAAVVAAIYTDFVTLLVVVPAAGWAVVASLGSGAEGSIGGGHARKGGRNARAVLIALGIALAMTVPLAAFKSGHTSDLWRDYLDNFKIRQGAVLLGHDFPLGDTFTGPGRDRTLAGLLGCIGVIPLLGAGAWSLWRRSAGWGRLVLAQLVFAILVMALASSAVGEMLSGAHRKIYQPRNLIVALYPYGIVLMAGTLAPPAPWLRRGTVSLVLTGSLAASVAMLLLPNGHDATLTPFHDWRAIAHRIEADRGQSPAAAVQPVIYSKLPASALGYYLRSSPGAELQASWSEEMNSSAVAASVAAGRPVYLVEDEHWWPLTDPEWAALNATADIELMGRWNTLRLYRMGPPRQHPLVRATNQSETNVATSEGSTEPLRS